MRRASILFAMTVIATTLAAEARAEDRYDAPLGASANAPEPLQTLTWPGKTTATTAPAISPRPAPRQEAYAVPVRTPVQGTGQAPVQPKSLYDPPPAPTRWRAAEYTPPSPSASRPSPVAPSFAQGPAASAPTAPAMRASPAAYRPPAAQPATPQASGAKDGAPPHFYSLARQYGIAPDPIALSPQFLAASPQTDMAEPPPLPPPHTAGAQTANMSTAAATNQVRQAQEAAADADSAALGN